MKLFRKPIEPTRISWIFPEDAYQAEVDASDDVKILIGHGQVLRDRRKRY
jgi:hypothetical protein